MPRDSNQLAAAIVRMTTGQEPKPQPQPEPDTRNPAAVGLSKLGASKGEKARAKALSKKERSKIAKKAANARWNVRK